MFSPSLFKRELGDVFEILIKILIIKKWLKQSNIKKPEQNTPAYIRKDYLRRISFLVSENLPEVSL